MLALVSLKPCFGAIAGRPIAIRYVDNRELGKQVGNAVRSIDRPFAIQIQHTV
jgi:hypothetical protein